MTITERCADPAFQQIIARAFPRWWSNARSNAIPPEDVAAGILRELCDGEPTAAHPEVRALFQQLERERSQIADL